MRYGLVNMSISMDMRKVLGSYKGSFGNCMVYNKVHLGSFQKENLSQAASSIGEVVAKMDTEGIMDLIDCDFICSSLETVDLFSAILKDAIVPIHLSCYIELVFGLGQVLILLEKPGDGELSRVVMVTLPRDEAVEMYEEDLILRLSPTILMNVK
ncbi:hypothetical protein TB1_016349 [Malus domestica]